MDTCSDEELMGRARRQDNSAFEELFCRYEQRVFAFFWRLSANRQEAEDGTQETFLRLWQARGRYEPTGKFSTYLFQIAKHHFLHERQKQVRRTRGPQASAQKAGVASDEPTCADRVESLLLAGEVQAAVAQGVAQLPETLRLAYVLTEQQGMSYQQAAEVLDCPVGTVGSRKVEAVRRLRAWLQPRRDELFGDGKQ